MHNRVIQIIALSLVIIPVAGMQTVYAQDPDVQKTLERMEKLLQQQQQELEVQREELADQKALIKQLQKVLQAQTHTPERADTLPDSEQKAESLLATGSLPDDEPAVASSVDGVEKSTQLYDPSNSIYDKDFPGAWQLPGTQSAMRIGGYVNLAVVNSFDPVVIPDRFITGSIPADGQDVPGAKAGTVVTANQTRVNLEVRQQTADGPLRAFVEGDFEGDGDSFRLRHAFGQYAWLLAGKTSSTLMDVDSEPEEVDFEGINGQILARQPQLRFSPRFGRNLSFKLAVENPQTDVINGTGVRGHADLVMSMDRLPLAGLGAWKFGSWNSRVGLIFRDLQAQQVDGSAGIPDGNIPTDAETGWGITTSGRKSLTWWGQGDFVLWQLSYGKGIGRYINDLGTIGGGDAVFDPNGKLHALPVFAGYFSYQHRWPKDIWFLAKWPGQLRSNLTFSWVAVDNFDFQDDRDYRQTSRASVNLIYQPIPKITLGAELLWGQRENKDGGTGKATQLQVSARYDF
jgi:hypothetical protein